MLDQRKVTCEVQIGDWRIAASRLVDAQVYDEVEAAREFVRAELLDEIGKMIVKKLDPVITVQ